ncbi:carboxypeptidase regulatory-like domain-containing protein [Moheibacter lacus]|uniref:Carboxypeptidase regulatory-like domain-containing protein n=1 Tax=Moheibacter lacus TaxID=2745851 RepID=A0A838ZJC2_9FLAO|nr:carboxypeptidase regulatory-like domain-containing protein [Moheibacter lacus]MBA5629741.1 carboxypeptidase regulatory-like domain-containing protein [Moheibacter lacus]
MKNLYIISILTIFLFGCSEDLLDGTEKGTLKGSVRLDLTNEPLANVKITTTPSTLTVYSDEEGNFEILESIPLGDYSVKAELNGYVTEVEAVSITDIDQTVTIVFEMITDETLNQPPTTPELLSPANLATNVANDVTLKWSSSDPDQDTLLYRVLVTNNTTNELIEYPELEVDTLQLNNLDFGTTYTWQVVVSDDINDEVFSESSQFTVRANPEYRYHYVQRESGNFIIKSSNLEESIYITTSEYSSWRPHKNNIAQKVAYLQTIAGQTHLVTADLNGDNPHQISQAPVNGFRPDVMDFDWNTNGSRFIFPSFDKLYRINYDGTGQTQIYQTADGQFITKCSWNYDSSRIAIVTNNINGYDAKIIILDGNGNFIQTIFEGNIGAVGGLDWSITGDRLLYTHDVSGYQDADYRQLDTRIMMYNFSDATSTDISALSEKPLGTIDVDPQFSPNDAEIIFTNAPNDLFSVKSIYTIDLNSSEYTRTLVLHNAEMIDYE